MRRLLTLLATALLLFVFPIAAASAEGTDPTTQAHDEVASLNAQVAAVQRQLDDIQSILSRWSRRLEKAQRDLTMAQRSARAPAAAGSSRYPDRAAAARTSAKSRVDAAQQQISAVSVDSAAVAALLRLFVLQDQLRALEARRSHEELIFNILSGRADPAAPVDAQTWSRLFLSTIDAPACQNNLVVLVAWQAQESTSAVWNPLATTHLMDGATAFNGVGVRNFVSLEQGLDATRETLELGSDTFGYQQILLSLRACADPAITAGAVNASAWCRGCSGGAYLIALLPIVQGDYPAYASRTVASA